MSKPFDKLGKRIRSEYPNIGATTLNDLQEYRISHKDTLSYVFKKLCVYSKKVSSNSIVTFRIKRFESIIGKLLRIETLNLGGMWDIGGCRCILANNSSVYKLVRLLQSDPDLKIKDGINDYIKSPKANGYKSVHLYVGTRNSKQIVEIQIRNQTDHNWATLVEITDLLYKTRLKENQFDKDFTPFHRHLSIVDSLSLNDKRHLANIMLKKRYFDRLCEVFTRNNIPVRKQWLESKAKGGNYFLISTSEDGHTSLQSFPNFGLAEEAYFDTYKNSTNANIVLTHLPKPTYDDLSTAYSNYILTYHTFLDDFYEILENLIIESIETRKYFVFRKYWILYTDIVLNHIYNLLRELRELSSGEPPKKAKIKGRELEWYNHINKQFQSRRNRAEKFNNKIRKNLPTSMFWNFIFTRTMTRTSKQYTTRLNDLVSKLGR